MFKRILLTSILACFLTAGIAHADWTITFGWTQNPTVGLTGYQLFNKTAMTTPLATIAPTATTATITVPPGSYDFVLRANTAIASADSAAVHLDQAMIPATTANFKIQVLVNAP